VTNPIAKSVLYAAGFGHPGHTEFLAHLAAVDGKAPLPGDDALVRGARGRAGHDPCTAASGAGAVDDELIVETGRIVAVR
jgi:4-hydroxythreonine-4-phosphate dehydrogenase